MIDSKYDDFLLIPTLILLLTQIFLSSIVSLILFTIFKDISIAMSLIFLYMSVELATFGNHTYLYHVFYLDLQETLHFPNIISLSLLNFVVGLMGYKIFKSMIY